MIDRRTVLTGTWRLTPEVGADDTLLIIKGHPELPRMYRENFFKHKEHCKPAQIKQAEMKDRGQHRAAA